MFFKKIFSKLPLNLWMGLSIVLMAVCVLLVMTLSDMAPKVQVMPQLFRQDALSGNQFVEATAISPWVRVKESRLIDEMLVRFYVENRYFYVPDRAELAYRYGRTGPVARLSTPRIYNTFLKGKGNYLEDAQTNPETISVDIWRVARRDNVFYVDFDVYRFMDGRAGLRNTRRATIKIGHNWARRDIRRSDFANPYGFYVMSYEESALQKR